MALLRRRPFGLVLADIHVPVMDGLKLAKEIRRMDLRTPAGQVRCRSSRSPPTCWCPPRR